MLKMKSALALMKNTHQAFKQYLANWFPRYIVKNYFKELDLAIQSVPLKIDIFENELLFIDRLVTHGSICVDIGSNRGEYLFALEKSGKCKTIHAVEPVPELHKQLQKLFPKVVVHTCAISNENGQKELNVPYIHSRYVDTRATLESFQESGHSKSRKVQVATRTLDDFIKGLSSAHIDLIKMDIEGHEHVVLTSSTHTLQVVRPIWLIEIEQRHHSDLLIGEIFAYVLQYEYVGYFFNGKLLTFENLSSFNVETYQQTEKMGDKTAYMNNFIFIPQERDADFQIVFREIENAFDGNINPQ